MANTIIRFEDHGQDFLTWEVNEFGVVVDCKPCQTFVWKGCVVKKHTKLGKGDKVIYGEKDFKGLCEISHPVLEITEAGS